MPQKNTLKDYSPDSYYHVYSRGVNKQRIFLEARDKRYFLGLLERYLSTKESRNTSGFIYPNYNKTVKLLSYCLMSNHIHLLLFQLDDPQTLRKFMSSLMTAYSKYFNQKYHRVGSVFESRYKAKIIDSDSYLTHISRYIHMNPRNWETYHYSSLPHAFNSARPAWLSIDEVTTNFDSRVDYLEFLRDYQTEKDALEDIKEQLANK